MDYIPLKETRSPRVFKWARRLFIFGLLMIVLTVLADEIGLIAEGSALYGIGIFSVAAGLFMFWEVG